MLKLAKITLLLGVIAMLVASCKSGCVDTIAKNYDPEARREDGSCEYYTNTDFLTMGVWKYSQLSSTGIDSSIENIVEQIFDGATMDFKLDGTAEFVFAEDPPETRTWEFNKDETQVILDKGTVDEDSLRIATLNLKSLATVFEYDSLNISVNVAWEH